MNGWQLPRTQCVRQREGPLITAPDHVTFDPESSLPPHFVHWRTPIQENYAVSPPGHDHQLRLTSSWLNLTGLDGNSAKPSGHYLGQTFITRRQVDTLFTFSIDIDFSPSAEEHKAGISIFLVQNRHFDLGVVTLPPPKSSELSPHFRFRGISYLPTPPEVVVPVNSTWLDQTLTMEARVFNFTHYALSAGPAAHQHLMQTIGYAPAADLSFGFTGTLFGAYGTTNGRNGRVHAYLSNWRYQG